MKLNSIICYSALAVTAYETLSTEHHIQQEKLYRVRIDHSLDESHDCGPYLASAMSHAPLSGVATFMPPQESGLLVNVTFIAQSTSTTSVIKP